MFRGTSTTFNQRNYSCDKPETKAGCLGAASGVSAFVSGGIAGAAGASKTVTIIAGVTGGVLPLLCGATFFAYHHCKDRSNNPENDPLELSDNRTAALSFRT